jgi:rare lipoprotein A
MNRFLRQFSAVVVAGILVAGCVSRQPEPLAPPPPPNAGVYKIGKPYQVNGIWYYPQEQPDYDETGIASWYGPTFYGKYTANGEIFDAEAMTAAHKTLPMPVNVRVTNLDNGRSLVLRVNDRGPFVAGRIIDVSEGAAKLLGFYDKGTARVRVVFLNRADQPNGQPQPFGAGTPETEVVATAAAPRAKVASEELAAIPGSRVSPVAPPAVQPMPKPAPDPTPIVRPDGKVTQMQIVGPTHLYVQVGAFGDFQNARRLMALLGDGNLRISTVQKNGVTLYRVRLGPFDGVNDADAALERMTAAGSQDAKIMVDQ